ncbi:MAG: dihydroneopterin aldolase family protein, partial [Methanotrichaceae archaeon]|nr:dihydroneopterin aldolase family protein [Methanotrichaceae archaeon]
RQMCIRDRAGADDCAHFAAIGLDGEQLLLSQNTRPQVCFRPHCYLFGRSLHDLEGGLCGRRSNHVLCSSRVVSAQPGGDAIPAKREIAAFEAGIKLGALYHQFVGAPVSVETASSLELAIAESISLQPYVAEVKVKINREMLQENVFGYGELQGKMIFAEVVVDYQGEIVRARLEYDAEKDYPLMRLL